MLRSLVGSEMCIRDRSMSFIQLKRHLKSQGFPPEELDQAAGKDGLLALAARGPAAAPAKGNISQSTQRAKAPAPAPAPAPVQRAKAPAPAPARAPVQRAKAPAPAPAPAPVQRAKAPAPAPASDDLAVMSFIQLKRHLKSKGFSPEELDQAAGKDGLLALAARGPAAAPAKGNISQSTQRAKAPAPAPAPAPVQRAKAPAPAPAPAPVQRAKAPAPAPARAPVQRAKAPAPAPAAVASKPAVGVNDLEAMSYMKLKQHLKAQGVPSAEVDKAPGKDALLLLAGQHQAAKPAPAPARQSNSSLSGSEEYHRGRQGDRQAAKTIKRELRGGEESPRKETTVETRTEGNKTITTTTTKLFYKDRVETQVATQTLTRKLVPK
eukprot:TRINITY_DN4312_c0_g2_i4.p1 TRINITY_DN4312_c0_g2~~TRINITY_DN4312_c0_g2_i4.p1  ORF type:complete len:379 (+),score=95.19 TRINITY_DN4312_c0_g2_i4:132-1268(+)